MNDVSRREFRQARLKLTLKATVDRAQKRMYVKGSRSKYDPHQGDQECERRRMRQIVNKG